MAKGQKNQQTEIVDEQTGEVKTLAEIHEENKKAPAEAPKKRKKETVISGAEYWDFEKNGSVFVGRYCAEVKREKDGPKAATDPSQKAGSTIGYDFEQEGTGEHWLISNSHAIEKALSKKNFDKSLLWEIEFLGKGVTGSNQPYNRFEVSVLLDEE